jgi:hypothetical protein
MGGIWAAVGTGSAPCFGRKTFNNFRKMLLEEAGKNYPFERRMGPAAGEHPGEPECLWLVTAAIVGIRLDAGGNIGDDCKRGSGSVRRPRPLIYDKR